MKHLKRLRKYVLQKISFYATDIAALMLYSREQLHVLNDLKKPLSSVKDFKDVYTYLEQKCQHYEGILAVIGGVEHEPNQKMVHTYYPWVIDMDDSDGLQMYHLCRFRIDFCCEKLRHVLEEISKRSDHIGALYGNLLVRQDLLKADLHKQNDYTETLTKLIAIFKKEIAGVKFTIAAMKATTTFSMEPHWMLTPIRNESDYQEALVVEAYLYEGYDAGVVGDRNHEVWLAVRKYLSAYGEDNNKPQIERITKPESECFIAL